MKDEKKSDVEYSTNTDSIADDIDPNLKNIDGKIRSFRRILQSLTGVVTAIGGLVGAAFAAYIIIKPTSPAGRVEGAKQKQILAQNGTLPTKLEDEITKSAEIIVDESCLLVAADMPDTLPLSLKNTVGHPEIFPYWFRVEADNKCSTSKTIRVSWDISQVPSNPKISLTANKDFVYTLNIGERWNKNINPPIEFLGSQFPDIINLTVRWAITDERELRRSGSSDPMVLLKPTIFRWALKRPTDNQLVPKEFLIASLANWVQTGSKSRQAQNFLNEIGPLKSNRGFKKWIEKLYLEIGQGNHAIEMISSGRDFPPILQREILTPSQILLGETADPLETALTLGALVKRATRKFDIRLALFMLPNTTQNHGANQFIFAWSTSPGSWKGIDTSKITDLNFEQNLEMTTDQLLTTLARSSLMVRQINTHGAFFDEKSALIGLDFGNVENHTLYRVYGLPKIHSIIDSDH